MPDQPIPSPERSKPNWRKSGVLVLIVGVVALGVGVAFFLYGQMAAGVGANPDDPVQVAMGKVAYQQNCASCHGVKLEGQSNWRTRKPDDKLPAPPHDETGHTWHHPDEHLFRLTKNGLKPPLAPLAYKSDMPAFGGVLADKEIWAVLAFVKSTWPKEIKSRQDRMNEAYKQ